MKAVIAQSDVVTAYGWGLEALWNGLLSGQTAIKSSDRFSNRGFVSNQLAEIPDLEIKPGESRSRAMLNRLLAPLIGKLDPQTTLILSTTVCEIEFVEQAVLKNNPELAQQANPQNLLSHLKSKLGLNAPALVLSSACASSSAALAQAAAMIEREECAAVLVIACDSISEFVYSGFSTLLSLCDTPARPFDAHRCGLSLGEAAAWALITSEDSPLADANSPVILGWNSTTDAVHMTAPDRQAGGLSRAITAACKMAEIVPSQIGFIAAHGTATIYNDAMELLAFRNVIVNPVPVFSIKGGIGHTLGAAGLTQILVTTRALSLGTIPPTVGLSTPDASAIGWVQNTAVNSGSNQIALSTNSGFGGVNTALLFGLKTAKPIERSPATSPVGICAVAWFSNQTCGSIGEGQNTFLDPSPSLSETRDMTTLIGRPIKYFPRMTRETRTYLAAASLALTAARWSEGLIGIMSTGFDDCIDADQIYFRDYVTGGLSLGRGNLFIYTLPTSAQSEVAIALNLTGPTLHVQQDRNPVASLIRQAKCLVAENQARSMLVVFGNGEAAMCLAIGHGKLLNFAELSWDLHVPQLCTELAARMAVR